MAPLLALRLLVALMLAAACTAVAACGDDGPAPEGVPPFGSGVNVQAQASPTCPVETVANDPACAPTPIAVPFEIVDAGGARVATGTTGPRGENLLIHLDPGSYTIRGTEPGPPTVADQAVTVRDGEVTGVLLEVDTGIR